MKILRKFLFLLLIPLSLFLFTGCNNSSVWNVVSSGKEVKIPLLVSSSGFEAESSFFDGAKIAMEEAKSKGIKLSYKILNDGGNFDRGVALAKEVINNKDYPLALSFQSMDTLDTVSKLFDEAKKPLFAVDGLDDNVLRKNMKYVFSLTSSAEDLGIAAGRYVVKNGYKSIATAHSQYSYEINFLEGFSDAIDEDESVTIYDSVQGPYKEKDFESVWDRWSTLGIDAVLLSFADVEWGMKLIELIKTKDPNIAIIADQYFNYGEYLKTYERYVEGMVMPSNYPVDSGSKLSKFYSDYKSKFSIDPTALTAQGFDLVNMIISKMQSSSDVDSFVDAMKSEDGYVGVGEIKFNSNGSLNREPNFIIVKNGAVKKLDT